MKKRIVPFIVCFFFLSLNKIQALTAVDPNAQSPLPKNIRCSQERKCFSKIDGAELIKIPSGIYSIGDQNGRYDEKPVISVRLKEFLIDRTEVSNARFEVFVQATGYRPQGPWRRSYPSGGEEFPVRFVTWHDAVAYAKWAGRRLPTEAEWEATAGPKRYSWGNRWESKKAITLLPLGHGPKQVLSDTDTSSFGVLNLSGNVREWVSDWYDRFAYSSYPAGKVIEDPQGPKDGAKPQLHFIESNTAAGNERSTRKVVRGASWAAGHPDLSRRSKRGAHNPKHWYNDIGFRCAISLPEKDG